MNIKDPRNSEAHVIEYRRFCIERPEFATISMLDIYLLCERRGHMTAFTCTKKHRMLLSIYVFIIIRAHYNKSDVVIMTGTQKRKSRASLLAWIRREIKARAKTWELVTRNGWQWDGEDSRRKKDARTDLGGFRAESNFSGLRFITSNVSFHLDLTFAPRRYNIENRTFYMYTCMYLHVASKRLLSEKMTLLSEGKMKRLISILHV